MPYLTQLTADLVGGLDALPEARRGVHISWLRNLQQPDGGFPGREGGSDLYYTAFALRGLAVAQGLDERLSTMATDYLRSRLLTAGDLTDLFSLIVGAALVRVGGGGDVFADAPPDWPARVAALVERHRRPDGGFGRSPEANHGSTYITFLLLLTLDLLGHAVDRREEAVEFIRARRRADGGFVEIPPMRRCGANPTAAAIGALQLLDALDEESRAGAANFLSELSTDEGGYRAHDRIPVADLLSTFTAGWSLYRMGESARIDAAAIRRYAASLEQPGGGFFGAVLDEVADAEYTFYGLGVLGLAELVAGESRKR